MGLYLSCGVVLMLPFDASMSQSCELDPNCGVITVLGVVWKTLFTMIGVMALVLIPFAYFWYETDDEEGLLERLGTAVCWSIVAAFLFIALLLALYLTSGFVDLRVTVLDPYLKPGDQEYGRIGFYDPTVTRPPAWDDVKDMPASTAIQTIQTSWMVYILALLSFLGWCLMTIFAGIGMVSLPMDMISAWFNRPRPIDLKQFAEKKIMLKKRCEDLIQEGRNAKDGFKNRPNKFRETRFTNKFRKLVLDLEDDMEMLDMCYKKNQINPLLPFFNLAGRMCSLTIECVLLL
jgi:LMBR1 domain-containing protein 1